MNVSQPICERSQNGTFNSNFVVGMSQVMESDPSYGGIQSSSSLLLCEFFWLKKCTIFVGIYREV